MRVGDGKLREARRCIDDIGGENPKLKDLCRSEFCFKKPLP
jgi:hypothetical protein